MDEANKIGENNIKAASSGEVVQVKSLWADQDCVVVFFRRFGCLFCRLAAKQLSEIKPQLDAHNVRLVGIGVEELGVEEFIAGGFFSGDVFIDMDQQCYKDLNYKRFGVLSIVPALFSPTSIRAVYKSFGTGLTNDLKGNYYQVGGAFVVKKGGEKVLFSHKQKTLADHVDPKEVLKCLNIE